VRVVLRFWNICSQLSFHVNLADFLRCYMMGWVCSTSLGRKREMAVRRPMRRCTSLTLVGLRISMIVLHFSRLASIPRLMSMNFIFHYFIMKRLIGNLILIF